MPFGFRAAMTSAAERPRPTSERTASSSPRSSDPSSTAEQTCSLDRGTDLFDRVLRDQHRLVAGNGRRLRDGDRAVDRPGVGVRDRRRGGRQLPPQRAIRGRRTDHRAPHRGPVAGGPYPAAARRHAEPQLPAGPQRRQSHAGRHAGQPPSEPPRESAPEHFDVARRLRERGGHERRVFAVVGDHAAARQKPVSQRPRTHLRKPPPRQPFQGQPDGVADDGSEKASADRVLVHVNTTPGSWRSLGRGLEDDGLPAGCSTGGSWRGPA